MKRDEDDDEVVDVRRASRPVVEDIPILVVDTLREAFRDRHIPKDCIYLVTFYYDGEPYSYPLTIARIPTNADSGMLLAFEQQAQQSFLRDVILDTEH